MERTGLSMATVDVLMVVTSWVVTPGTRAIKKRPVDRWIRKGALDKPGEIFVQRISPAAHRRACAFQPPWDFSVPGWQPLVSPKGIPDDVTCLAEPRSECKPTRPPLCVINFPDPIYDLLQPLCVPAALRDNLGSTYLKIAKNQI